MPAVQVFLAVDVGAALGVAAAAGVRSSMAPCLRVLSPDGEKVRAPCPTFAAATLRWVGSAVSYSSSSAPSDFMVRW